MTLTTSVRATGLAAACLLGTAAVALPATAWATPAVSGFSAHTAENDVTYLHHAMQSMVFHTELAQLAREKGGDEVRAVGEQVLLHDHGSLHARLNTIATRMGVQLPHDMTGENQAVIQSLREKKGKQFDRAWAEALVASHASHLDMVRGHASQAHDDEVRTLANEEQATLEQHFAAMRKLTRTLGAEAPKNINAGTGGGSDESPLPLWLGAGLVVAGAGMAGRSVVTLRRAR